MDKRSLNRQHMRSLQHIRWGKKTQPAEQSRRVIYICTASLIQQMLLFGLNQGKACQILALQIKRSAYGLIFVKNQKHKKEQMGQK